MNKVWSLFVLAGIDLTAGCAQPKDSAAESTTAAVDTVKDEPAAESQAKSVDLQVMDWEAATALVKQHRGKVVVMDVWATYCPPCIDEFPHLVRLHQTHGEKVACISVSADFDGSGESTPQTHVEKVHTFLKEQKATFQNVLLSTSTEDLFGKKIVHESIPIVLVYNQQGELAAQFPDPTNPDEFTYEQHVLPAVMKLLE